MTVPQASPGEVIDVRPLGERTHQVTTTTLVKTDHLSVVRLVLPAGKELAPHKAPGDITVHCLEGRIAFTTLGRTQELIAGQMLYLPTGEEHAVQALEDSSVLLTIRR